MAYTVLPKMGGGGSGKVVCVLQSSAFTTNYGTNTKKKGVINYDGEYFNSSGNCIKTGKFDVAAVYFHSHGGSGPYGHGTFMIGDTTIATDASAVVNGLDVAAGAETVCTAVSYGDGTGSNSITNCVMVISL